MKLRAAAALLIPFFIAFSAQAFSSSGDSDVQATPTPSLLDETLHILHFKHTGRPKAKAPLHHGLEITLDVSPSPVKLSGDRVIKATITLSNPSAKNFVHLDFPTSQRFEILVRDASGKVVNTWSEDQSFTNDPAAVTINPGERLEYTASVATREMTAGHPYIIEASFPSSPDITVQQQVTPQK